MRVIINVIVKSRATLTQEGSAVASSDTDGTRSLFPFCFSFPGDCTLVQPELLRNQERPLAEFVLDILKKKLHMAFKIFICSLNLLIMPSN